MKYNSYCFMNRLLFKKIGQIIILILLLNLICCIKVKKTNSFISNNKIINIDNFNKEVNYIMNEVGIPGMSLAIIENNQIVYTNAFGYKELKNKNEVDQETIFEGCSLSKSFLVFIVYQLVNEGKLDLDKPMYQYLENVRLEHDSRYKLITPRMILSHCSGIENWQRYNNPEILELISEPGKKYVYSGEGYDYLASVIEVILKQSYEEYIKERIIMPFQLKTTYLKFENGSIDSLFKVSLVNYAIGHDNFGSEITKWKNKYPIPSGGISTNANDYAKLLVSIFNKKYLSKNNIRDIIKPIVGNREINPYFFLGAGFAIYYNEKDTIVFQGGSNAGFKANTFYSIPNKRGFVFFTNSDRGILITAKLNELTSGFNLDKFLGTGFYEQYPSNAIRLLKIYQENDFNVMNAEIEKLISNSNMGMNTLNELGDLFLNHDRTIAKTLLERNIKLYPECSVTYGILGDLYLESKNFNLAYINLKKAKELKFDMWEIDQKITHCKNELDK